MTDGPSDIENVYGYLLCRFRDAGISGDAELKIRIDAAIHVFEELWPDETRQWMDRF